MDPIEGVSQALGARATEFVREHRLPGVAAAIVQGDRLAWFSGAGFSDIASRRWPDSGTLYLIASITKTFTGTAIMQLRDAGALALDDPASEHLPELRGADARFGPIENLLATIEFCKAHQIVLYGGGQTELGIGRDHIQALASLFYSATANDVAPREYNTGEARGGLPQSPLPAPTPAAGIA